MSDAEKRALRDAFGSFATGVTVVTCRQSDGTPRGFTANSFSSVSLEPPLLLICIAKSANSCAAFCEATHFAINVLAEDQRSVSGLFASQAMDKFDQVKWRAGAEDVPLIEGALAQFVCARDQLIEAGDHWVLIGRVVAHHSQAGAPLGYYRGQYFTLGLEDALVHAVAEGGQTTVGALVEQGRALLLQNRKAGYAVPKVKGADASHETMTQALVAAGLTPQLDFLYAVYEDKAARAHSIFYHGTARGAAPDGYAFVALDAIDLARIEDRAERAMVARYIEEFRHGRFGIYQGDVTQGKVQHVAAQPLTRDKFED